MKNVAFIPVRGGSKSIPLKNICHIYGKPLIYWVMKAACDCNYLDCVYIATDSLQIREVIEQIIANDTSSMFHKIQVIGRSPESASDTASTEFAMLEFAPQYEFETITLIQATSPLLTADDLNRGFEAFAVPETDSVLSVVRQKRFCWETNEDNYAKPINYDIYHRPRRQDFNGYLVENGAFYITSKTALLKSRNRISGNIKAIEMNEDTYFEIDEPSDWNIIESLLKRHVGNKKNMAETPVIKMFLTDCDGCLTDGGMYYSEIGDELKKFNTRDGNGFSLLKEQGIITGIITGEDVELNRRRVEKLKIDILESGCKDKEVAIRKWAEYYNIGLENICYVGDDINDISALRIVGMSCCPADAVDSVKAIAKVITRAKGGQGVIREIVDQKFQKR